MQVSADLGDANTRELEAGALLAAAREHSRTSLSLITLAPDACAGTGTRCSGRSRCTALHSGFSGGDRRYPDRTCGEDFGPEWRQIDVGPTLPADRPAGR